MSRARAEISVDAPFPKAKTGSRDNGTIQRKAEVVCSAKEIEQITELIPGRPRKLSGLDVGELLR
jgi:hypothetical protein